MKKRIWNICLIVVVSVLVITSPVSGVIISADADGYSEGTNISTAFNGMTLSSVGSSSGLDGFVYAYDDDLASTGTSVFGHNLSNHKEWYFDAYPEPYHPDDFALRVDFDQPANSVSVDIIVDDIWDYASLKAYDSSGVFLDSAFTQPPLTYGEIFTATINRDSFDIAYVIAGGKYTNSASSVLLDNLLANVIPEPVTYYVDGVDGDDDNDGLSLETAFATIQKGIDSANDGDTVLVAPGTYTGPGNRDIDFLSKAITVRSENGPENGIIDCQGGGRGFYFHNGENNNSVLDGFTITNGNATSSSPGGYFGGGIYCDGASPTITSCIFRENTAHFGGGMHNESSSPTVTNCIFRGNTAVAWGGGMCNYISSPIVTGCFFEENNANFSGGMDNSESSPTVVNCVFSQNYSNQLGGGMSIHNSPPAKVVNCIFSGNYANGGGGMTIAYSSPTLVVNCTFSGNSATTQGGGIVLAWSDPKLTNCIFWGNQAPTDPEITKEGPSDPTVSYTDVQGGWPGEGNINADPCFIEPGYWADWVWVDGDYHLLVGSPCIDAGDNTAVPADTTDLDGDGNTTEPIPWDLDGNPRFMDDPCTPDIGNGTPPIVDMGAYEYEVMVSCFGVNHVKLETKAGKKGNKVELKGTFDPALPIDLARDDVAYIIDDGLGNALAFLIPAGSFEVDGKPDKQKFRFHSPKGSQPDIKAKFDFDKCKFELNAKEVMDTDEITSTTLTIELWAGANLVEEVVQVEVKPKHIEYRREPKLSCCPKCKGIALLEVTSDQGVFVFEPEPGKEKLKRKTVVDDGVNGRVKIDTSCSKPLEVGDVFGAYTVTDLIKIFDDWPNDE